MLALDNPDSLLGRRLLARTTEWARESISYIEKSIICRVQAGYVMNELLNYNTYYKGGCQQLLSILNGLQDWILRLAYSFNEQGALVLISNELEIMTFDPGGGGTIIECNIHHLFEPENLVNIFHEAGHHLLSTSEFEETLGAIRDFATKYQFLETPKRNRDLLRHIFADMIQLLFGFLGDINLYSRHFWTSFHSKFSINCASAEDQEHSLILHALRYMFVLFNTLPQFKNANLDNTSFSKLLGYLQGHILNHFEINHLVDTRHPSHAELHGLFLNSRSALEQTLGQIKKAVLRAFSKVYLGGGTCNIDTVSVECIKERKIASQDFFPLIIIGTPISYVYNDLDRFNALKHAGRLTYVFNSYVYNKAMNIAGNSQYLKRNQDGWPVFAEDNPPLLRDSSRGGYFVIGSEFRAKHFRSRLAFLLSLWDITIKEKREIVEHIFGHSTGTAQLPQFGMPPFPLEV